MCNIFSLGLENAREWSQFLNRLPIDKQDIYYTPEYYKLYEELGDGLAKCFVFQKGEDIAIYPFLMNEINVLGYDIDRKYFDIQGAYGYNGVVSTTEDGFFVDEFYGAFNEYCKKNNIIAEFTRFNPLIGNKVFSEKHLNVIFDRKTVYIDLKTDYEIIFKNFQTTTRKQIKRTTNRYKIEVKCFEKDINQLDTFLSIYHTTMDRVESVQYLYFNRDFLKNLIEKTQNVCFIAYYEGVPIGAIIALYNQYYIHGHLGGALFGYLPMSPYSLLYSEMIKYGQKKGCRFLHVGGGTTSKPDDSLLKYKLNFSDTTLDFFIGKKIHNKEIYDLVVGRWEEQNSQKKELFKNLLLKYRY
mgnify:CR=1 FL=1